MSNINKLTDNDIGKIIIFIPSQEKYKICFIEGDWTYIVSVDKLYPMQIFQIETSDKFCWYQA